jgi:hypothetical protein
MIHYNLDTLDQWIFHVNSSFIIPQEHIDPRYYYPICDVILEDGDYFKIFKTGSHPTELRYMIEILNKGKQFEFSAMSTIHTILHNSTLNKEHKSPFFSECRKMYRRNETIDSILK